MIDLTPLDVRNKRGDFKKGMRGYDPQEVDVFLELVAERLEALVRENIQLRDRTQTLQEQVNAQAGREQAVQDALVTAQELRKDIREQSQREADHMMREAESEARRMIAEAESEVRSRFRGVERKMDQARDSLQELERRRQRFLQEFRGLLQREMDVVQVEEERIPLEDRAVELDLGGGRAAASAELEEDVGELADREDEPEDAPVDVADLEPEGEAPSSLELELMAGAEAPDDDSSYPDVPDLETVLAEAGMNDAGPEEVEPPAEQEISPPPAEQRPVDDDARRPEDRLALFDKDEKGKKG